MRKLILSCFFVLSVVCNAQAGQINTFPNWNGSDNVHFFGYPDTATYGQTVTATAVLGTQLDSFSFQMNLPTGLLFRGEVYAWNGVNAATGPALFESPVMHTSASGFQLITFNTPGLAVTAGQQYVLFATISRDYANDVNAGLGSWGLTPLNSDAYPGGQFVFLNDSGNPSQWTTVAWSNFGGTDLAFQANFSSPTAATPEPASMTLIGIGAIGMAGYGWRRRQHLKVAAEMVG